ncbi:MAG TPA: QueT transporter family protein, partial [Atribacteraceae bacterium]|nr:QueT transporter family protein [Atribacteraceae bacterium]
WLDTVFGSALTLVAAFLTSRTRRMWLAPLPPVLLNGFGVALYLSYLFGVPYGTTVMYILAGQTVACYGIGLPVLGILRRRYPALFTKRREKGLPGAGLPKG